jgi:hypothetical protein
VQTFTLLDLLGAFAGIIGLARASFLFFVGKGTYSPRGFMHCVLRLKRDESHSNPADTEVEHISDKSPSVASSGLDIMLLVHPSHT